MAETQGFSPMDDRLTAIFRSVFPELAGAEAALIRETRQDALASWDSANHLLLLTCLEEEFGVYIPPEQASQIESYEFASAVLESLV